MGTGLLVCGATAYKLPSPLQEILSEIEHDTGLAITTVCSSRISSPVTLSLRTPLLLLPEAFIRNATAEDFRVAVAHEDAHMVRHDFIKNLIYEILSIPIAFHPVMWWIRSHLNYSREVV
jgi:beta-lactamase regulating signal transducer with metallopeptidase domain